METVNEPTKVWTRDQVSGEKRDVWTALKRGLRRGKAVSRLP
jgi:hypothetical protein